jgi:hypothetical protein
MRQVDRWQYEDVRWRTRPCDFGSTGPDGQFHGAVATVFSRCRLGSSSPGASISSR